MNRHILFIFIAVALSAFIAVMPVSATPDLQTMTDAERAAYWASQPLISCELRNIGNHLSTIPCYGECSRVYPVYAPGDTVELHGENTATSTTYLFLTGPGLPEDGAQIVKPDPAHWPVKSDSPDTFRQVSVKSDHTWDWTWDTHGLVLEDGTYSIYAVAYPYSLERGGETPSGRTELTIKNPTGTATTTVSTTTQIPPATVVPGTTETFMPDVITIMTRGGKDYTFGDEINFTGTNTAGWKTYLFITGPGLAENGSQIQSTDPGNAPVVNDNPVTFKQMDVQGDHTWSWRWGTANTKLDPGTYTVWAVGGTKDAGHLEKIPHATVSITLKKPAGSTAAPVASVPTTLVPSAPGTTTAPSPGFGLPAVLAGLGVVGLFMNRRH